MNIANYTGATNGAGEVGQYPLSTETLDFIQKQILLLQSFSHITGDPRPWVIKTTGSNEDGLLAYNGELLTIEALHEPMRSDTEYHFYLIEEKQEIVTQENRFVDARVRRFVRVGKKDEPQGQDLGRAYGETDNVYTLNTPTLDDLRRKAEEFAFTTPTEDASIITDAKLPQHREVVLSVKKVDASLIAPMSIVEVHKAMVTTQTLQGSSKSFIQTLETVDGVKYRRVVIASDEVAKYNKLGVEGYGWRCLPNQIVGSAQVAILPQTRSIHITQNRGILEGAVANFTPEGVVKMLVKHVSLLKGAALRVEVCTVFDPAPGKGQPVVYASLASDSIFLYKYIEQYEPLATTFHLKLITV